MSNGETKLPAKIEEAVDERVSPLIRRLPPQEQEKVRQIVETAVTVVATSYQGPMPPPDMLRQYAELIPDAPERMLALVERQAQHRQTQEAQLVGSQTRALLRGQIMGYTLAIFFGCVGAFLAVQGHTTVATVIFATTIVGLGTVFALGRRPTADKSPQEKSAPEKPSGSDRKSKKAKR
jgi:uncharacterized membrane protein